MAKKIGVFCPSLNFYGGGEFVAVAIANTLAQNGHDVVLFTSSKVEPPKIKAFYGESLNLKIKSLQQPKQFNNRGLGDFYQTLLQSVLAKNKCDVFVDTFTNCVFPWTGICYMHFPFLNRFDFKGRFPYLSSPHLLQVGAIPHVAIEKNLANYDQKLVLANSHYTAQEIKKYSNKTAHVLYPPYASSISTIAKNAQKNPRENLVVTTSRFESNKRLERIPLIAAKTHPDIQFAVIGRLYDTQTLTALRNQVQKLGLNERVRFYPDASAELKFELLKKAKIYLHTMVGEHFGISIVEAMALGCMPVVHDSGGMREFVPEQHRYLTLQDAAGKINSQTQDWTLQKTVEMKRVADNFSYSNFSLRFMRLFSDFFGA